MDWIQADQTSILHDPTCRSDITDRLPCTP